VRPPLRWRLSLGAAHQWRVHIPGYHAIHADAGRPESHNTDIVVEHLNWAELAPEQSDEIGDCCSIRGIGGMRDAGSAFRNDQLFGLLDNLSANIDDHDDSARTRERNRSRPPDARILAHPAGANRQHYRAREASPHGCVQ
jgi:hypothetical protein